VPKAKAAILVDEQFGAAVLRAAAADGYATACPAEKSGQEEFDFEYGEDFAEHIEAFHPTFCKVLVRYNPEGDAALNRRQAASLRQLSQYLQDKGQSRFMFELLVPPEKAQLDRLKGDRKAYDEELRPRLMVETIEQLQDAQVEPDVWKIEGLDRREDGEKSVAAARRGGRTKVGLHHPGTGRRRQQGARVSDDGSQRAGVHRLRRRADRLLGAAHRVAGHEEHAGRGSQRDRTPIPRVRGHLRASPRATAGQHERPDMNRPAVRLAPSILWARSGHPSRLHESGALTRRGRRWSSGPGATVLVAGSSIFGAGESIASAMTRLRTAVSHGEQGTERAEQSAFQRSH
jgi:hypothetical protein